MRPVVIAIVLLAACVTSCGSEVGRVRFAGEGSGEAPVSLKAGEVSFWSDLDIEYRGDAALAYRIELLQGGAPVATATCDPLGRMTVKTGWVETNLGDSHSRRGVGKMTCEATLAKGGPTTIKAALAFAKKPEHLELKKADLVLKQ